MVKHADYFQHQISNTVRHFVAYVTENWTMFPTTFARDQQLPTVDVFSRIGEKPTANFLTRVRRARFLFMYQCDEMARNDDKILNFIINIYIHPELCDMQNFQYLNTVIFYFVRWGETESN
jgi:ABC-type iron transport system FetAB ATPase subunit